MNRYARQHEAVRIIFSEFFIDLLRKLEINAMKKERQQKSYYEITMNNNGNALIKWAAVFRI